MQEVWRYQLEQNKTHSHATPVVELAAPPVEEASVGSVLYTFSNWKDADALVIAGRDAHAGETPLRPVRRAVQEDGGGGRWWEK